MLTLCAYEEHNSQEYLLVSQFAQHVEVYRRDSENTTVWSKQEYGPDETVELQSVDITITMNEIYQGIDFAEFLMEE